MSLPSPPCCSQRIVFLLFPLFISFCPSLLLFFLFLGASGHRILFVTLRGARWQRILLASHLFPYLSPCLFPTCLLISLSPLRFFFSGCFRSKESPCLPFLTSLSIAQCSSFWWLWGQDSSPICFRTRLSTSLSHVAVLSGCFRGTVCSLSSVCLRACPPCSLQLMPLLFLSLSLAVLLSRCLFGHMILSGSSLVLPCPPLFPPTCILNSLLIAAAAWEKNGFPGLLCFSLTFLPLFRSHSLTLGLYHMLPYLPSYLSPTCLLILSPLPCFFPGLRHLGGRG